MKNLILGSTSKPRKELLTCLQLPFTVVAPGIEESQFPNESGYDMAKRLAVAKAHAVQQQLSAPALIIACDQVICLEDKIFGKPDNHQQAIQQLTVMSGKGKV